jgi:GGDEF domain-containing protein
MHTVLGDAYASLSLDEKVRRIWEPLSAHLDDAVAGAHPAPLLDLVESESYVIALDATLTHPELMSAFSAGCLALREAVLAGGADEATKLCRRLQTLERDGLVRLGVGYCAGLEEHIEQLRQKVEHHSVCEVVTGALKADEILCKLAEEVTRCQRMDLPLGVVALSLHVDSQEVAEETLRRIGEHLTAATRPYDSFGRIGEGLYLLLFPDVTRAGLMSAVERLRHELSDQGRTGEQPFLLFSLAHFAYVDVGPAEMVKLLDQGMERLRAGSDYLNWS